jgi:hypothetical protein
MLVDPVRVIGGSQQIDIKAVVSAGVAVNAILDGPAVQQILHMTLEFIQIGPMVRGRLLFFPVLTFCPSRRCSTPGLLASRSHQRITTG